MELTLGRRGDYAVRAVLSVARHYGEGRVKAGEISKEMDIPRLYVPQILAGLVKDRILDATAGRDGGYTLAVPPEELTLLQVVESAEEPIALQSCVLRGGPCDWRNACPVHNHWSDAQRLFRERLGRTTFAMLVADAAALEAGDGPAESAHRKPTVRAGTPIRRRTVKPSSRSS